MGIFNEFTKKENQSLLDCDLVLVPVVVFPSLYTWTSPDAGSLLSMDVYEDEVIDPITFTTIATATLFEVTNGMPYQNSGVNSGTAFQLRYASYDGRGWVETFLIQVDEDESKQYDSF